MRLKLQVLSYLCITCSVNQFRCQILDIVQQPPPDLHTVKVPQFVLMSGPQFVWLSVLVLKCERGWRQQCAEWGTQMYLTCVVGVWVGSRPSISFRWGESQGARWEWVSLELGESFLALFCFSLWCSLFLFWSVGCFSFQLIPHVVPFQC